MRVKSQDSVSQSQVQLQDQALLSLLAVQGQGQACEAECKSRECCVNKRDDLVGNAIRSHVTALGLGTIKM